MSSEPNTALAQFDIALPGSQPVLQHAVILPALRAALALNCDIQLKSTFDRKHYFYHDQPAGYQITQYYQPFAKNGWLTLNSEYDKVGRKEVRVRIKQVQLEQDTARSQELDSETTLLDFNRSGHALVEIISLPDIHSPSDAAAYVRKVQSLLYAVDAVTTGMEDGGLRADVNVSVRRRSSVEGGKHSYAGVGGLGQRTEIKNLSTFAGIEAAVKAERDRQIAVILQGGSIDAETRGWSITKPHETRRLRGKEGEVDYRYMPDPDIPPLYIHADLVQSIYASRPPLPDELASMLVSEYGVAPADVGALLALDDGERLLYFQDVVDELATMRLPRIPNPVLGSPVSKWVLHELGALLSKTEQPWSQDDIPARELATLIFKLEAGKITYPSAKEILRLKHSGDQRGVQAIIEEENLTFVTMSTIQYEKIALEILQKYPKHVIDIKENGKTGKIQFLMGQLLRHPEKGNMQPTEAEKVLRRLIFGEE